jgi:ribose transport system substrate-binding protein
VRLENLNKNISLLIAIVLLTGISSGCSNKIVDSISNNLSDSFVRRNSDTSTGSIQTKEVYSNKSKRKIGVVLKALDSEHWLTVKKGAEKAAEETNVDIAVLAPAKETNIVQQFKIIEDLIYQKVDALVIAPCDSDGIKPLIDSASTANIPVFTVDTNADTKIVSFAGTNNKLGGKMAGERIVKIMNGKGKVALITGVPSQQTHRDRSEGFKEVLAKYPGINLVAEYPAYSDFTIAISITEKMLQSIPDLDAIFCTNTSMSLGAMDAIDAMGKIGKVKIIGFDTQSDALSAVQSGNIDSTVAQNPYNMGYQIIKNAVNYLNGEYVPKVIDTGTDLITKENVNKYIK